MNDGPNRAERISELRSELEQLEREEADSVDTAAEHVADEVDEPVEEAADDVEEASESVDQAAEHVADSVEAEAEKEGADPDLVADRVIEKLIERGVVKVPAAAPEDEIRPRSTHWFERPIRGR